MTLPRVLLQPRAIAPSCHNPEQLSTESVRGGRQHPFGLDAALARGVQPKEVHHDVSNDGEVVGSEASAHGGLVFVELDVEAPVKSILHFPVAAHRMSNPLGISRRGTDVVAPLATGLGADGSLPLDDGEALQIRPLFRLVEPIHGSECPTASHFGATVTAVETFTFEVGANSPPTPAWASRKDSTSLGWLSFTHST